jgi:hypothetical protein
MISIHPRLRGALVAAVTLVASAVAPSAASAGQYPMYAGNVPNFYLPAPSQGAWTFFNNTGQVGKYNSFPIATVGAEASWSINYPSGVFPQNTAVGMQLTIPGTGPKAAISIARVVDWSETYLTPQNLHGGPEAPAVGMNLAPSISAAPGGSTSGWNGSTTTGPGHDSGPLAAGTKTWPLGVSCAFYGSGFNNCTLPTPFFRIRGIKTILEESVQPHGELTGGALTAGGIAKGTETVGVYGADAESGVDTVEALLDDVVVATASNFRDRSQPLGVTDGCTYSDLAACPSTLSSVLSADTTKVADGAYELRLRVTDAAGNVSTVLWPDPVVVDNHPAPVNTELPAIQGAATEGEILYAYDGIWQNAVGAATYRWKRCSADLTGCVPVSAAASYRLQAADVGKRLQLEVTRVNDIGEAVAATSAATDAVQARPATAPPVITKPVEGPAGPAGPTGPGGGNGANGANGAAGRTIVLHLNGHNAAASASLKASFTASGRGTLRSAYGKKVLVTGRLLAPGGTPISGAKLQVLQQDKLLGAAMVPAGEVTTDATGTFRFVTTAVRSRTIRFAYRVHLEDATFASTTDISLGVIAKLSLSASPRSLRNGHAVVFRGSVAGAPAGARKVIELQVKKGSRWMTFRSTRLRAGRYSERYRFTRTRGRVTYVFRARVREEAGFPFLTSHSRTVKVTVRG